MEFLAEWRWMLAPLLACLILSITHVYLGIHVVARKVIFVDLALAQIAALGATYAMVLGYDANLPGDDLAVALFSLAFTFVGAGLFAIARDRKSTRLNSSHSQISYAVFCLKKKTKKTNASAPEQNPKAEHDRQS